MNKTINNAVTRAEKSQKLACDPMTSVWVSASAGTGKTKVLTDRVLNLLVNRADPNKIICLTFTKAAAAEMESRILSTLSEWATMDSKSLATELSNLLGKSPDPPQTSLAASLFSLVINSNKRLNIQTIHAFCQSLLRQFPIEAGVSPHFSLIDDADNKELLNLSIKKTLELANKEPRLDNSVKIITSQIHETTFPEVIKSIVENRSRFESLLTKHGDITSLVEHTRKFLGADENLTAQDILSKELKTEPINREALRKTINQLKNGKITDVKNSDKIEKWLTITEKNAADFDDYLDVFFTSERKRGPVRFRKSLVTGTLAKTCPECLEILEAEAKRLYRVLENIRTAAIFQSTKALVVFSDTLLTAYENQKIQRSVVDYDDLIIKVIKLLTNTNISSWILYKLDGGYQHILIDEAQDTNPEQWKIIIAVISEFFSGKASETDSRTVFAVGDFKQSIYSFQGADPDVFNSIRLNFSHDIPKAKNKWREVSLDVSFRSTSPILDIVDRVFNSVDFTNGLPLNEKRLKHISARIDKDGLVELWPLAEPGDRTLPKPWKPPIEQLQIESPPEKLAETIAKKIKLIINNKEFLINEGKTIEPGDIMILVQHRGNFVDKLVGSLKSANIPVAGNDRLILTEYIAVMDLIALARFSLLPEDDLSLATCLKSPIVGLSEEELFDLAYQRDGSLWNELKLKKNENKRYGETYRLLSRMIDLADKLPPYEYFNFILEKENARHLILSRLGEEAVDPISEFLNLAIKFESNSPATLEGFIYWLETGKVEIKRDLSDEAGNAVRVLTVHGAKGLQAPVVFLPDTTWETRTSDDIYWIQDKPGEYHSLVWGPYRNQHNSLIENEKLRLKEKQDEEKKRLLYVAMTRAQDHLYICGWKNKNSTSENCWYTMISNAFPMAAEVVDDPNLNGFNKDNKMKVKRITSKNTSTVNTKTSKNISPISELPAWTSTDFSDVVAKEHQESDGVTRKTELEVTSPLEYEKIDKYQKGKIVHTLLQFLPELPPNKREKTAKKYLEQRVLSLDKKARDDLLRKTLAVINHPELSFAFDQTAIAEAPIYGTVKNIGVTAQIDRLLVKEDRVIIIDYKSNMEIPQDPLGVPKMYLRQLATYKKLVRDIYPDRQSECFIIWTEVPTLMKIEEDILAEYEP